MGAEMGIFSKAFFGSAMGKLVTTILLVALIAFGFGLHYWVRLVTPWWNPNPGDAIVIRIVGVIIGVAAIVMAIAYLWPLILPKKFVVMFDADRDIDWNVAQSILNGGQPAPQATYVHLRVASVRDATVTCFASVISLERLNTDGSVSASLTGSRQLLWAPREFEPIQKTISPNAPQHLDIFRSVEGENRLEPLSIDHPQVWLDFFDAVARYRITVVVAGAGRTQIVRLLVDWRGRWDDFDVTLG